MAARPQTSPSVNTTAINMLRTPLTQPMATTAPGMYGVQGYGGAGGGGYGSGYGGGSYSGQGTMSQGDVQNYGGSANTTSASYQQQAYAQLLNASLLLNTAGVPNDYGQPRWPLALRILEPDQTDPLRAQIGTLMLYASQHAMSGSVSPLIEKELGAAIARLRELLIKDRDEGLGMRLKYDDALDFLARLDKARESLASLPAAGSYSASAYAPPAGASTQPTPTPPAPAANQSTTVGVFDNYFDPANITIPSGGTVTWTSNGQHHHTITADDGQWSSSELMTGTSFSHTFTQPGTYSYHCNIHPGQMQGTVVVK
jgi:plastocyanin